MSVLDYIPFVMILILVGGIMALMVGVVYSESGEDCSFRSASVLKSVNSIEDIDTGILSSGTISEKTLLFEDGLVASFKIHQLRGSELVLGRKYGIRRCTNNGGRTWYEIGSQYISDANVLEDER